MRILLTAFEPFGEDTTNSSRLVLDRMPDTIGQHQIERLILPVCAQDAIRILADVQPVPDAIVLTGQAGGRKGVTVERIAVNCASYRIPDNKGFQPIEMPIDPAGPDGIFTTLPLKKILAETDGITVSDSAGTYVCNHLFYLTLRRFPGLPVGFVHIPYLREQGKEDMPDAAAAAAVLAGVIKCL